MEAKLNMETQFSKEDHDYALTHVHSKDKKGFFSNVRCYAWIYILLS